MKFAGTGGLPAIHELAAVQPRNLCQDDRSGMRQFQPRLTEAAAVVLYDQTKDRRVSANTEAEDQDGRSGETRRFEELALGVTS